MLSVVGRSSVGTHKSVNQDSWCALVATTSAGEMALAVVCDGVGGLSSGELASATVVGAFSDWFERDLPSLAAGGVRATGRVDLSAVAAAWSSLLADLNLRISEYGRQHGARLGTTFTGILVCQGRYVLGQVGDCRAYRLAGGAIEQLSEDQTLAARAVAEGTMTKEQALHAPQGSVLLQSVGTQRELRPEFSYGEARTGDVLLLCCDGFYRQLGDEGIRAAYANVGPGDEAALAAVTEGLIEQDMARGEKDNLTAVCLGLADADEPTTVFGPEGADQPTTLLDADEPTTVFSSPADDEPTDFGAAAAPAHAPAAPSGPDDATTLLTGDESTSSLEGGDGPWRA